MNKEQQVNQLVDEIVNNLIQQKQIVDQYNLNFNSELQAIREYIEVLLKKHIPKPTIIKRVVKKYEETQGPTIINITQTKTARSTHTTRNTNRKRNGTTSSAVANSRSASKKRRKLTSCPKRSSPRSRKSRSTRKKKVYQGPKGGFYYKSNSGNKVYVDRKQYAPKMKFRGKCVYFEKSGNMYIKNKGNRVYLTEEQKRKVVRGA